MKTITLMLTLFATASVHADVLPECKFGFNSLSGYESQSIELKASTVSDHSVFESSKNQILSDRFSAKVSIVALPELNPMAFTMSVQLDDLTLKVASEYKDTVILEYPKSYSTSLIYRKSPLNININGKTVKTYFVSVVCSLQK
jgi:hypothetical protein